MSPEDLRVDEFIGWIQESSARETAATLVIVVVLALAAAGLVQAVVWLATHTTADRPDWWLRLLEQRPRRRELSPAERAAAVRARRREREARVAAVAAAPQVVIDGVLLGLEVQLLDLQLAANEHAAGNVWGTR